MAAAESDPGIIKAVAGFVAATALTVWGWLVRRVVKRADDHDARINHLEVQIVQRATYAHVSGEIANVYRAIREDGAETREKIDRFETRLYDHMTKSPPNKGDE